MNSSSACAVPSASRRLRLASTSAGVSQGSFQMKQVRRARAWVFSTLFSRFGDGSGGCGMSRLLPSTFSSRVSIGRRAGGRGTAFELGEALLELLRRQRPHVDVDRLGDVGGLRRRELAGRDRGHDGRRGGDGVGRGVEPRQVEIDRLVLARRQQPVHAHAKRRQIAAFGEIDRLARERLAIGLQQALHEDRGPVARPALPAGRISAFALVKRHGFSPCLAAKKYAARGRIRVRATKSPARSPARASRRSSGEYTFLEDSRYACQAKNATQEKYDARPVTALGSLSGPARSSDPLPRISTLEPSRYGTPTALPPGRTRPRTSATPRRRRDCRSRGSDRWPRRG